MSEENTVTPKNNIDFNCDLAQSFGVYRNETDLDLIDYMSSVNISCGFHSGDPVTIKKVIEYCKFKNKVIGAHIGFPDIQGFGYRTMDMDAEEIEAVVLYQLGALASFAKAYGLEIEHVRPHGAMYRQAAENITFSLAVARAIQKFSKWLIYYGAAGAVLERVADDTNICVAREIQLDKIYKFSGEIDYEQPAFVDTERSINRFKKLLATSEIDNMNEGLTTVEFDTIHFNNSAINSIELAQEASKIITPKPVNYNNVEASGWV